jgi:DNA replication and repair protein RecF
MMRIVSCALHDFRNHRQLSMDTDATFVVLTGKNGAGKTNLLEALSLFAQGRGFRGAKPAEQLAYGGVGWSVRADIRTHITTHHLVTGLQPQQSEKRQIIIDGAPANQQQLSDIVDIVWFLPTTSHLFLESSTTQRKYFDRMVGGFDREHSSHIYAYEHYMRERSKLLAMQADSMWIASVEQKMAEYSVVIASSRLEMIAHINAAMSEVSDAFPHATMQLSGDAEQLLQHHSALEAEASLRDMFKAARAHDAKTRRASHGAHKSRFAVTYAAKQMHAEHCSTGEQKALLIALLMAQIYAQTRWNVRQPILLLDEMVAHLDGERRAILCEVLHDAEIQTFVTGTDSADFQALQRYDVRHYVLEEGKVLV